MALVPFWPLLPKLDHYRKGNVVAYGYRDNSFERPTFFRIEIGDPRTPFAGRPPLSLRLPDGTLLRTDRLDAASLRHRSDRSTRISAPSLRVDQGWRPGMEELQLGGFRFLLDGEKVVWLGVASSWEFERSQPAPEIGTVEGDSFYSLPLDRDRLIELFGEPDELSTSLADPL